MRRKRKLAASPEIPQFYNPEDGFNRMPQQQPQLQVISNRSKLNTRLRSRCRWALLIIAVLAMLVTFRSGLSASRGYALVATQNEATALEQENERLRIEIARLKSPQRISRIAEEELGMVVPKKMYFTHER